MSSSASMNGDASWRAIVGAATTGEDGIPLALGFELRQHAPPAASQWSARRVETATARGAHTRPTDLMLSVRPLMPGAREGAWVQGSVSWESLRRPGGGFVAAHARWFAELHSIARELRTLGTYADMTDWLVLDNVESSLLWPHLRAAAAIGIPLVSTHRGGDVLLAGAADISLRAARGDAGALELSPVIAIDGVAAVPARIRPIGTTGLYGYDTTSGVISITLAPADLSREVRGVLASAVPLRVPAQDESEFLREHYPRLSRRLTVSAAPGVRLPTARPPVLVVRAEHRAGDVVAVDLAWDYFGVGIVPYAPADGVDRDENTERDVSRAAASAWRAAVDTPFRASHVLEGVAAAEFVTHALPALEDVPGVRIETTGVPRRYRELLGEPRIRVSTVESPHRDWFDLGILVSIDGRTIPFGPLFTALSRRRKKMLLSDGAYFSLAHPALDRLRELIDESGEVREWEAGPRISRYRMDLWEDFEDLADEAAPAVAWRGLAAGLRDIAAVPVTPIPAVLQAELRPYQREGFEWLAFLWRHRLGGVLADDMGLGKTLQTLALIAHARGDGDTQERRPFLVVAPTSVLSTWSGEAARFAPALRVAVVDSARDAAAGLADASRGADVVITSYAVLRLADAAFAATPWAGVVLDEAQFVKNPRTRVHQAVKSLDAAAVYALTGTPLENSLSDLWAIFSLTSPGLFPSAARFRRDYIGPIENGKVPENEEGGAFRETRLRRLRRRIRPFLLRRTKQLVAPDLPAKQEQRVYVELSPAHRARYDTVLQRERQKVLGLLEDLERNRFIVFRSLTLLRMLSLAPALLDASDAHLGSSKLDALVARLAELSAEGHRALVFSQFTSFLDLVEERLGDAGIAHSRLDGSTRRRGAVIERFRHGNAPVFLISLKAGGFGLTVTEADYVFLLDPWWNPAAEAQAVDRAHRIGQTRAVMVYRLIAADTIEEKVMALQERKARLFDAVMDDDELFARALTADDVRALFEN